MSLRKLLGAPDHLCLCLCCGDLLAVPVPTGGRDGSSAVGSGPGPLPANPYFCGSVSPSSITLSLTHHLRTVLDSSLRRLWLVSGLGENLGDAASLSLGSARRSHTPGSGIDHGVSRGQPEAPCASLLPSLPPAAEGLWPYPGKPTQSASPECSPRQYLLREAPRLRVSRPETTCSTAPSHGPGTPAGGQVPRVEARWGSSASRKRDPSQESPAGVGWRGT